MMIFLAGLLFSAGLGAAPGDDACAALSPDRRSIADALLARVHPYDCCDDTLARCLAQANPARLLGRLRADVCRRVAAGQKDEDVLRAMERRAASMLPTRTPTRIDVSAADVAGVADAPVLIIAYACARCPFCSKLVPLLHSAVTGGRLKGKARFAVRVFPIRDHAGSTDAALAFEAARTLGRFWPFALKAYASFDRFSLGALPDWAAEAGLDRAAFQVLLADAGVRARVVDSKKEGLKNGIEATPTLFLTGRRYTGDLEEGAITDVVEEEIERIEGTICKP